MPETKLTTETRRAVQLAALSGEDAKAVAKRYGISRQTVYDQRDRAKREARGEYEHWRRVVEILGEAGKESK